MNTDSDEIEKPSTKVVNIISTIVLAIMVVFVGYVIICTARGKAASVFGRNVLRVVTGSMEPTIMTSDYVVVRKTDVEQLKEGDIIAFYSEDPSILEKLVIHRIVSRNEDGSFVVKGDANPINDRYSVKPEKIVGRYTGKARFFNWVSSFTDARKLLLLFVIIPILLITIHEIKSMKTLMNKVKEEEEKRKENEEIDQSTRIEQLKKHAIEEYLASQNSNKTPESLLLDEKVPNASEADEVSIEQNEETNV